MNLSVPFDAATTIFSLPRSVLFRLLLSRGVPPLRLPLSHGVPARASSSSGDGNWETIRGETAAGDTTPRDPSPFVECRGAAECEVGVVAAL